MLDRMRVKLGGAAQWLTRQPELACGDCERWRRCGLPPDVNCAARAEQMERDGARRRMRTVAIASEAGWIDERR